MIYTVQYSTQLLAALVVTYAEEYRNIKETRRIDLKWGDTKYGNPHHKKTRKPLGGKGGWSLRTKWGYSNRDTILPTFLETGTASSHGIVWGHRWRLTTPSGSWEQEPSHSPCLPGGPARGYTCASLPQCRSGHTQEEMKQRPWLMAGKTDYRGKKTIKPKKIKCTSKTTKSFQAKNNLENKKKSPFAQLQTGIYFLQQSEAALTNPSQKGLKTRASEKTDFSSHKSPQNPLAF